MKKIFLDTETTGLLPDKGDRIVEIAAIAYDDENQRISTQAGGEYHYYLNPQRRVPPEAYRVHGLNNEFLDGKPLFADIADSFIEFISGSELIIHNAEFDCNFLNAELKLLNKPAVENIAAKITCSLKWSRENNHAVSQHNLDALCRHFNISLQERKEYHSAIVDTRLLGDVYFRMRQQQGEIDIKAPSLPVSATTASVVRRQASAEEIDAHNAMLEQMEKASGIAPLYKQHTP